MICRTSDIEIETVYSRIIKNEINLQPDFQRGEVWSLAKKKKLIDSIIRGWRIPPIHVVENNGFVDEVLDGQQRLVAIRDFIENQFAVDGNLNPQSDILAKLNGLRFEDLDDNTKRQINKYSITLIRLTDYHIDEPAELFYRLNQPATLTSAEQRNAFIGNTRNQIKELSIYFESIGANKELIGFSNSRMAYDEILSKFCFAIECGNLRKKITSFDISEKYRADNPFLDETIDNAKNVLKKLISSLNTEYDEVKHPKLSLNKATLYSWMVFVYRNNDVLSEEMISKLINSFEAIRQFVKGKITGDYEIHSQYNVLQNRHPFVQSMFMIFNQKASMGSTDANSIIARDVILELFLQMCDQSSNQNLLNDFHLNIGTTNNFSQSLDSIISTYNWGDL